MGAPDWRQELLAGDPVSVAPKLLGWLLHSHEPDGAAEHEVVLRITEVEAYRGVGADPGSHAHRRRTPRNASMFASPGTLYVYFTYGMHWCANIVAHESDQAGAVLVRAGEVVQGVDIARARRSAARSERDLARGPARLCAALAITGSCDGLDLLTSSRVWLTAPPVAGPDQPEVLVTTRSGVSGPGAAHPWRFALRDPSVSPHRPGRVV